MTLAIFLHETYPWWAIAFGFLVFCVILSMWFVCSTLRSWWKNRKPIQERKYDSSFSQNGNATGTVSVRLPARYLQKKWESSLHGFSGISYFDQPDYQFKPRYFEDAKHEGWTWP